MTKDAPAFDFYPERWLAGVADLSDLEQIAYLRLLCHQWLKDGLPEDRAALSRLAGRKLTDAVLEKIPVAEDGKRRNKRLEVVREDQRKRIIKSREKIEKMNSARQSKLALQEALQGHLQEPLVGAQKTLLSASSPITTHQSPHIILTAADASGEVLKLDSPPPSKPKKETQADPRFTPFRDSFVEAYETATGTKYAFQGGKDGTALSSFLKTFKTVDLTEFTAALRWCRDVAASNPFAKGCVNQTASLAAFCSSWNQIVEYHQNYQPPKK